MTMSFYDTLHKISTGKVFYYPDGELWGVDKVPVAHRSLTRSVLNEYYAAWRAVYIDGWRYKP